MEWEIVPEKFVVTLDDIRNDNTRAPMSTYATIPSSYDLRNKINISVGNQGKTGICYAYTTVKSVETNLALTKGLNKNLSEIHLAVKSGQFSGGNFGSSYNNYFKYGYGPITEKANTLLEQSYVETVKDSNTDANNIYYACSTSDKDREKAKETAEIESLDALNVVPEVYVLERKSFTSINGEKKKDNSYANEIQQNRNLIKQTIMSSGSIYASIYSANYKSYNGKMVHYNAEASEKGTNHAVSIIGWDDNFKATNFPTEWGVKSNGAWLVLNSWGSTWGNGDGTFWISYEDYYVETSNHAVIETSVGKKNISDLDITLSPTSYTYDGNTKTPTVTVKYNDNKLDKGIDYAVAYSNNTNAGTATVTITGQGNYTKTITKQFTINKGDIKIGESESIIEYDGKQHGVAINFISKLEKPTIKYGISEENCDLDESPEYKDVGEYTVYYKITDENYNDFEGNSVITINPKSIKSPKLKDLILPKGFSFEDDLETEVEKIDYIYVVTGDNNGDGKFNSIDLLKLARHLAGLDKNLEDEYLYACNVCKDEKVNQADLLKMARVMSGLDYFD